MTKPQEAAPRQRILVVGHGTAGTAIARDAVEHGHHVVGFLDDGATDPQVLGTLSDVNRVVQEQRIDALYFAIPTIRPETLRKFLAGLENTGIDVLMLPRTYATITREIASISDLTDVDVLQLVGREPVKHDLLDAQRLVRDQVVLVTGAAGSIGSRLVEHLLRLGARSVIAVDWWETGLFHLANRLADPRLTTVIADIKNTVRVSRIFETYTPALVFHAAAYKHVPLMESHPIEALLNNTGGTDTVLRHAIASGASHAVYVSTDKAVRPANVMGASKRLGELILADLATASGPTKLTAVRFGNVLESNGSVVETFRRQIRQGGPVTVTHPDVTRFFMTIDEASQLIIQSALLGENGDVCVLDMGEPVRILDLATSLVKAISRDVPIVITGLRPGEKLYEELSYRPDLAVSTSNEKVFVFREEDEMRISLDEVRGLLDLLRTGALNDSAAVRKLTDMGFRLTAGIEGSMPSRT